jgi:cytochrome c-type biogenesis protein CcmH
MRICYILLLLTLPLLSRAAIEAHNFDNPADEERFSLLINELRCPKCQNQNISDSNAPLAADLRQKVAGMIEEGKSNEDIVDYMVQRYGDFVSYRPPFDARTWLLWFGPFALMTIAGLVLAVWIRRRGSERQTTELSAEERERLNGLLQNNIRDNQ